MGPFVEAGDGYWIDQSSGELLKALPHPQYFDQDGWIAFVTADEFETILQLGFELKRVGLVAPNGVYEVEIQESQDADGFYSRRVVLHGYNARELPIRRAN